MIFQRKTEECVYVFFSLNFLVRWEIQNSMKTTFQKLQKLEQISKNIPRAVTMYRDHRKSNKY